MKAEYTPGPWLVIGHSIYQIESIGGRQVLHGGNRVYGRGNKNEIKANIQAMGAVPELVEACQAVLGHRLLDDLLDDLAPDIKIKLQAALAKAGVE